MTKYKLIHLLRTLSETEWESLEDFLRSPYFTKEKTSLALAVTLRPHLSKETPTLPAARSLFEVLWPETPFDQKRLTYALSQLNKLTEKFLISEARDEQSSRQQLTALKLFSERQLEKHFAAGQRTLVASFKENTWQDVETFLIQSDYAELMDQHYIRQKVRKKDHSIQNAANHLDRYYFLRRLQFTCSMLDRQNILDLTYATGITPSWLDYLTASSLEDEPIINLYLTIYRSLLNEEQENYFQDLRDTLLSMITRQASASLAEPLLFAINYCARKIRAGKENYLREAINLYRIGIQAGLLLEGGKLSAWTYTNIIKLCIRLKEYDYANEFINSYTRLLPEGLRENAYHYNYAELLYHTNEKVRAQQYLVRVAYSDLSYYLGARVLLAKILCETGEEEALLSLLAAFTIFLQRNHQISRDLKRTYLNFCRNFARILRTPDYKMTSVYEAIKATHPLAEREWLLALATKKSK